MPTDDQKLAAIVGDSIARSIDDVIARLRDLDLALGSDDGLKWFNLLYLKVTEAVRAPAAKVPGWENPEWLERLDVEFARFYFATLNDWLNERSRVARAWLPLLESRSRRGIMRVQFALAGINAHINHDLPLALVATSKALRLTPKRGTSEHRDYDRVNSLLDGAQEEAKQFIATGIVGLADQALGNLDDNAAGWGVRKARETAWSNCEILWRLGRARLLHGEFLTNLDRLVCLASRGLLIAHK